MTGIEIGDALVLRAAVGWLELDLPREALAELDQLASAAQDHPDVLEVRWLILAQLREWNRAAEVSTRLTNAAPERASSWLHHAYATRRAEAGGLEAAFNILAPVAERFSSDATLHYNLACYTCQLKKDTTETLQWFSRALQIGKAKEVFEMALHDDDLKPLWPVIQEMAKKQAK